MSLFTNTSTANDSIVGKKVVTQLGNPGERSYDPAKDMTVLATFNQQWGADPSQGNKVAVCDDGELYCLVHFSWDDNQFMNPQPCTDARRKGGVGGGSLEEAIASFGLNS